MKSVTIRQICRTQQPPSLAHIKQKFQPFMLRRGMAQLGAQRRLRSPVSVIASRQPMGEAKPHEVRRIMLKAHSHLDMLERGLVPAGDEETHDYLCHVVGIAQIRVCDIGMSNKAGGGIDAANELLLTLNAAAQGLLRARERHAKNGKWGLDGPAIEPLRATLEIYEQVLNASSAQQMEQAQGVRLASLRRAARG
jgi:hypothetical protein